MSEQCDKCHGNPGADDGGCYRCGGSGLARDHQPDICVECREVIEQFNACVIVGKPGMRFCETCYQKLSARNQAASDSWWAAKAVKPSPVSARIVLRVTPDDKVRIQRLAKRAKLSVSAYLLELLLPEDPAP